MSPVTNRVDVRPSKGQKLRLGTPATAPLIRILRIYRVDLSLPFPLEIGEQFLGWSQARAGDGEERVEEIALVIGRTVEPSTAMEPLPRDLQGFERDIAQSSTPKRRLQPELRDLI